MTPVRTLLIPFVLLWIGGSATANPAPLLAVVVNNRNSVNSISREELRKLLLGETRTWPDRQPVILVRRESGSEAFRAMLHFILKMSEAEYRRSLLSAEFRGESAVLVKTLNTNESAGKFVFNVPGAVAVIDAIPNGEISSQVKILRIDGKLPGEAGYSLGQIR